MDHRDKKQRMPVGTAIVGLIDWGLVRNDLVHHSALPSLRIVVGWKYSKLQYPIRSAPYLTERVMFGDDNRVLFLCSPIS